MARSAYFLILALFVTLTGSEPIQPGKLSPERAFATEHVEVSSCRSLSQCSFFVLIFEGGEGG